MAFGLLAIGCATGTVEPPRSSRVAGRTLEFLRPPLDGYAGEVAPEWAAELTRAYRALVDQTSSEVARTAGRALAARWPGFVPASVLMAQADFVDGDHQGVVERLGPLLADQQGYLAGQLLLGRSAELVGDPLTAYRAYRRAGPDELVARRGEAVADAASQRLAADLQSALDRSRPDQARALVDELSSWSPGSRAALEGGWRLAQLEGDLVAELAAMQGLLTFEPDRREWQQRRAELEVEVGDPKAGVDLYQDLARRYPGDAFLGDRLAAAKFRWRLQMMPQEVVSLIGPKTLSRGDFATLLYWLIPGARGGQVNNARIVSDVPIEHPQREAIVRVVNLGLLEVADATLHQFAPNREIRRVEALRSLVGWLSAEATCAAAAGAALSLSDTGICEAAARCRLIREPAECLPGAALSGVDARESVRRALDLVAGNG